MHEETRRNERGNEPILREGLTPLGEEDHSGNGDHPSSRRGIRKLLQVTVPLAVAVFEVLLGLEIFFQVF